MKSRTRRQHPSGGETRWRKRRLWSGVSFMGVVSLVGTLGFAFPETACAAENFPSPKITVLVFNSTQASPAILVRAESEAGRILGKTGLRVAWLECVGPSADSSQGPCQKGPDIMLRVLAEPVPNKFQDEDFGFAIHPVLVSVYYERAMRFAKSKGVAAPIILGCVIAHELGHLLLGSNGHSAAGIMQPRWERQQVQQVMMGALLFTSEQSKLMREAARTRTDLQARNFKEQSKVAPDQQTGSESLPAK
jgi:hypothetical protein